jgi:hypothetical protein
MFKWLANLLAGSGGGKTSAPRQPVNKVAPVVTTAPLKSDRGNSIWRGTPNPVLACTPSDGDAYVDRIPTRPPIATFETKTATGAMPPQPVHEMSDDGSFNVIKGTGFGVARSDYKPYPSLYRLYEEP